jgi:predicted PurR-regulated permease PerM
MEGIMIDLERGDRWDLFARLILVAGYILFVYLLYTLQRLLLLVFLGIILAIFWHTLATLLRKLLARRISHGLSIVAVIVFTFGIIAGFFRLMLDPLVDQFEAFSARLPDLLREMWSTVQPLFTRVPGAPAEAPAFDLPMLVRNIVGEGLGVLGAGIYGLAALVTALLIGFFLALNPIFYRDVFVTLLPPERQQGTRELLGQLAFTLVQWLKAAGMAMLTVGILVTFVLWIAGIDYFLLFGLFAGLLNIIPFLGPFLAFIGPAILAITDSTGTFIGVLIAYLIVQNIESNVIIPYFMEREAYVPPALTIIALYAMGVLFGFLGILLATPIAATLLSAAKFGYGAYGQASSGER